MRESVCVCEREGVRAVEPITHIPKEAGKDLQLNQKSAIDQRQAFWLLDSASVQREVNSNSCHPPTTGGVWRV